jgi:hypothetical protein
MAERYAATRTTARVASELDKLQTRGATLFHVRDGSVTKMVVYWERETGLDDLGIRPGGKAADRPD